jgi:hypothetical protein
MDKTESSKNFFKDKDGHIVIVSWPNIPLVGWIVFKVLAMIVTKGRIHTGSEALSMALLYTWAYMEIMSGVNYFRRLLGLIVLVAILISYFR